MNASSHEHGKTARIPRLVWTLAAVGLGAGILVMGIEFKALMTVDRQYKWTKATEERATRSLQLLRLERSAVFQDIEAHFVIVPEQDRPTKRDPDSLEPFVTECVNQLASLKGNRADQLKTAAALQEAFSSLSDVHQELEQYEIDNIRARANLMETWKVLQAKLVEAREATDKLEGRQRLQHQLMLRQYRFAADDDIMELASKYIEGMESVRDMRTLSSELGELTLLAERLHGETEIDQLISLKDNEIRQTLMRLYRATNKVAGNDREKLSLHIDSLMAVMFGDCAVDDKAHQTLMIGSSGLFHHKLQSLALAAKSHQLRKAISTAMNECREAERYFNLALTTTADANAIHAKSVFHAAWLNTIITGLIVAIVFIILSWRLARLGRLSEDQLRSKNESLKVAMDELEITATTDKLTGLSNRAVFLDRLEQVMKRSHRDGSRFAVIFFDLDRFKVVNDSLGHEVGDALLCDIANIFRREIRESDTVARFGGDEFVVLFSCLTDWSDAELKAKMLLDVFALPHKIGDNLIVSTASIGLVTNERTYEYPSDMIRDADAAMYQAKENGKAQVVVFDRVMHAHALERLSLEADLQVAVSTNDQFQLMYQPIVVLESGQVTGFEALIRWNHPNHGDVSPADFIPIAEETGMIIEIGRWVLRAACKQIADWNHRLALEGTLLMNVNISKRQLMDSSVVDEILGCLREFGIPAEYLSLEITESAIADQQSNIVHILTQLREHGLQIAMDDFGTGVSSLSALHGYPIDVLKIDQSFVHSLDGDRSLLAVVASITSLADNLGIKTVAEGIETVNTIGALQSIGCTLGQGYYFAKPMTPVDAEAYLLDIRKERRGA